MDREAPTQQSRAYTIKLYIFNDRCGIDSTIRTICVRNPPQASFTINQHSSCGPATINLLNTSLPEAARVMITTGLLLTRSPGQPRRGHPFTFVNGKALPQLRHLSCSTRLKIYNPPKRQSNHLHGCPEVYALDSFFIGPPRLRSRRSARFAHNSVAPVANMINCYAPGPFGYQWSFSNGNPSSSNNAAGKCLLLSHWNLPVQLIVTDSSCML
jgi:hypothetical protein